MMERDGEDLYGQANRLFDDGQFNDALGIFEALVFAKKLGAEPIFGKAECLQRLGRHVEAVDWYEKALDIDEDDDLAWNGKGVSLFHLGDYGKARLCFEVAYDLEPQNLDYLLSQVEMAMLQRDLTDALDLARRALDLAEDTSDTVLAWAFCIVILFLDNKITSAIDTTRAFLAHLRGLASDLIPENDYRGNNYDFSGLEHAAGSIPGCAGQGLIDAIVAYLKGDVFLDEVSARFETELGTLQDTCLVPPPVPARPGGPGYTEYPDINDIGDPLEREGIAIIEKAIDGYDGQEFMSFDALFAMYDWNADRGPAPFVAELENKFYIDIDERGKVRRIALDLDLVAKGLVVEGIDLRAARGSPSMGSLLRCPYMEDVYMSASSLATIVDTMRGASFGGREVALYVKVPKTGQQDLLALDQAPEAWEIDEIAPDFQESGKFIVGSLVWAPARS